jgi:hypothetical protein
MIKDFFKDVVLPAWKLGLELTKDIGNVFSFAIGSVLAHLIVLIPFYHITLVSAIFNFMFAMFTFPICSFVFAFGNTLYVKHKRGKNHE